MAQAKTVDALRKEDGWDLPKLGVEDGTAYGWFDRWNVGTTPDGKYITDMSDWTAREMHDMLSKDYKSQQIEKVLSLPITSATWTIEAAPGDTGEAKWMQSYWDTDSFAGGCRTSLDQIIGLMTSAFYFKRAYFEKVFAVGVGQFAGKTVYEDVAWRPQTTCRLMRDPRNGRMRGFEQEAYYLGPELSKPNKWPIQIEQKRAFVYTHGTRRDPINGTSDMEVAFWAYQTKMKILMLWFQFLQAVSLPRIVVRSGDIGTSRDIARQIARLKSSGVMPVAGPNPQAIGIDTLDVSGKGAEQFLQAIQWLDQAATQSVLAGFLDLTTNATSGAGSYALSKDASDFFLQSLESKSREMEVQIRAELFAPLIFANFGRDAAVPKLKFEPLNDIDKEASVDLLKQAMAAPPGGPVPTSFIAELAGQVATYLGMDGDSARDDFKKSFDAAAAQAQAKALTEQGGASPVGQQVAGLAGAVSAASTAIKAGMNPAQAHAQAKRAVGADTVQQRQAQRADQQKQALLTKHAKAATAAKTGGDASLANKPDDVDLAGFNPSEPRTPLGTWGAATQKETAHQKKHEAKRAELLKEKAALTAEAKHLRELIADLHIGTKKGQAGVHKGQAGTKASSASQGATKGAAATGGSTAGTSGSTSSSTSSKTAGPNLTTQVATLKKTVAKLKVEYAKDEKIAAKRKAKKAKK